MFYRMLIIDDTMPSAKGYGSIGKWFPGIFEVHEARTFVLKGPDGRSAVTLLTATRYDIILVDFNLHEADSLGPEIVFDIRNRLEGHAGSESGGGLNKDAYIIGVANGWGAPAQNAVLRRLKRKGLDRGLDGAVGIQGDTARQLRDELEKFLVSAEKPEST